MSQEISTSRSIGSGASVLKNVDADLLISGEMGHHEVLDFNHKNISVILLNHSNSERGYLKNFRNIFEKKLNNDNIKVCISINIQI